MKSVAKRYGWFKGAVIIAIALLCGVIGIAIFQFRQIESHLILHEIDYGLAKEAIRDAEYWLTAAWVITLSFIISLLLILASDYIVPIRNSLKINKSILRGLAKEEFVLLYQPQLNVLENQIDQAEVLIRWHHPKKGWVGPDEFIRAAEKTEAIHWLGEWLLDAACAQLQKWKKAHYPIKKIAINLSAVQLNDDRLVFNIQQVLRRYQLLPDEVIFEITESAMMENYEAVSHRLHQLHRLGVQIAIDDFGTGHSSLQYLRDLPIQLVKLDKIFVRNCDHDQKAHVLLKSMIHMVHDLSLQVIAEGVETETEAQVLSALGCHFLQGYWIGKPEMPQHILK